VEQKTRIHGTERYIFFSDRQFFSIQLLYLIPIKYLRAIGEGLCWHS